MGRALRTLLMTLIGSTFLLAGCAEVGITGRKQFNLMPESVMTSMASQQFTSFLSESEVVEGGAESEMVTRVGTRIRDAVDEFSRKHADKDPFEGYEWEFKLVDNDAINAFAMPGGKVVVYTGLLTMVETEADLAVVVAHEIAHIYAKHGAERMTQGLLVQMGGIALDVALREKNEETKALFAQSYGLGAQVGILLPFSRLHENEADRLGLIFMSMAGYDPKAAPAFWERMKANSEGKEQPPEFLSTHPVYDTRIENLTNAIPEAMEYYKPAG